jgi:hypothetical protein
VVQLIVPRSPAFIRGGVPSIDWSNPITDGLTGFWLFGLGNFASGAPNTVVPGKAGPLNLVTGLPATTLNSTVYQDAFPMQYTASAIGRGVNPKFATYYWVLGRSADLYGTAASFGITRRFTDLTAQGANAFGETGAGTISCYLPYSDSNIYWDFPSSASRVGPFAYTMTNKLESWVFTGGPAGRSIWRNGNRDFNNTTTTTAGSPGSSMFIVNKGSAQGGYSDMEYYVFATWNRQLTNLEGQSWTLDPLQFLRWPEDDIFAEWVGVAAGGGTSYSFPTAAWLWNAQAPVDQLQLTSAQKPWLWNARAPIDQLQLTAAQKPWRWNPQAPATSLALTGAQKAVAWAARAPVLSFGLNAVTKAWQWVAANPIMAGGNFVTSTALRFAGLFRRRRSRPPM